LTADEAGVDAVDGPGFTLSCRCAEVSDRPAAVLAVVLLLALAGRRWRSARAR
jgi:hypothetical protein